MSLKCENKVPHSKQPSDYAVSHLPSSLLQYSLCKFAGDVLASANQPHTARRYFTLSGTFRKEFGREKPNKNGSDGNRETSDEPLHQTLRLSTIEKTILSNRTPCSLQMKFF
jgi:hypothetical protein